MAGEDTRGPLDDRSVTIVAVEHTAWRHPIPRNDLTLVDKDPIAAWEDTYREYENTTETDIAGASRAVAAAWRDLAANTELPWWLLAAVHSAAEAFDFQADAREAEAARAGAANTLLSEDGAVDPTRTQHSWPSVVLPAARRPTNGWRILAEASQRRNDNEQAEPDGDS